MERPLELVRLCGYVGEGVIQGKVSLQPHVLGRKASPRQLCTSSRSISRYKHPVSAVSEGGVMALDTLRDPRPRSAVCVQRISLHLSAYRYC